MRNGCLEIITNDESALEVDENSTRDRLGRDDYYQSHYLMGPWARVQGLIQISETMCKDPKIAELLQKAIGENIELRKRINQYFEEEEKKKEDEKGDSEKGEGAG